ncbi:FecR family protein [uncultured Sneathiella sp.]|uniref:FecR family protein n=1 Tax=uncultured Sneathiella sp. TaxID=879315 RepID=UPI0030EEC46A|tara:strand:- start:4066 stop:4701 length:636 start_codon:yes stop_codon:yes gene_type:complete
MLKKILLVISLTIVGAISATGQSLAANSEVGTVTRLQSTAEIVRDGKGIPLEVGSIVQENDEINSKSDARVEITFNDGTKLLIGENARIGIDEYLYEPKDGIGTAILSALQGPFRFITGKISEMKEKRLEVKTSLATIGIRGTDFWGGPSMGTYGVFLFEGTIVVFNSDGGRIVSTPGTGVDVNGMNIAPGEAEQWNEERAQAAVATITFR